MKNKDEELALKRLEILEPYITKEKSLKNLSEETDISYSTLKRWASSYKKNGLDGLKKSERSDKSTYRTLNDETMDYIKEIYEENPNLKILDYYNKIISFIKDMGAKTVSYDTIYRVINQLDPYIKDYASENLYQAKASNEVFELEFFQIDYFILDERDDTLKKPYINIIYDNFSEAVSGFFLSFDKITLFESFALLRDSIFSYKNTNSYGKPKEFIINNLKFSEKDVLKELEESTGISVSFSLNVTNKLEDFFNAYNDHYLKMIFFTSEIDIDLNQLTQLTKKYIEKNYNRFREEKISNPINKLKRIHTDNDLDPLLTPYTSKRKVKDSSIRFQNILYEHPMLHKYEDLELEVRYNPFDLSRIKVFDHSFYVCDLSSEIIGDYPLSYYDFLCIKKAIKIKFANSNINLKQYAQEFKDQVSLRYSSE